MQALIDADTPVYVSALASEDEAEYSAKRYLDNYILNIIKDSGCSSYSLFVSGTGNFRKEIDHTYKENRKNKPEPKYREMLRQHLIKEWGAFECNGYEADDGCGIHQESDGSTIICGIDKDLLQIPGLHYQWPIIRKGVVQRPALFHNISVEQGWRNLFAQVLTGDTSDNIRGVPGIGPKKATSILAECKTEEEMYNVCLEQYINSGVGKEIFDKHLDLLYILRELGITYNIRKIIYG